MSFLDKLRAAPSSLDAIWNTFLLEYSPNRQIVFVIHEGREDPSFYRPHIRDRFPTGWEIRFVCCGTKKMVLKRSEEFADRYAIDPRVLFFVDKDHDDLFNVNEGRPYQWTYTTSCYSIENILCKKEVVRAYLTDIAGAHDMDPLCAQIVERYDESRSKFHELGISMMAWIVCARRHGISLNLNNIDTGRLFRVTDQLTAELVQDVPAQYVYLATTTGGQKPNRSLAAEDIEVDMKHLQSLVSDTWFRGKQDVWFLVKFLLKAVENMKNNGRSVNARITLAPNNALEILGPRTPIPICLSQFLDFAVNSLTKIPIK
jgi:hypothetical protein